MNIFVACLEKLLRIFTKKDQLRHKRLSKKFEQLESSISQISMPSMDSPQHIAVNNFMEEQDNFVFVSPNIDQQTGSSSNKNNLFINKCNNGRYYILNGLENAYIDECHNTFIFVGPCTSTLFIRHCKNVKVRAISQQLRIQSSQNVQIQGIVGVRPVLESSKNITFYSFATTIYDDLLWQIQRAQINVFANQIFECYDFTPKKPPNFQNQNITQQIDDQWQTLLEERQLIWEGKKVYLPKRLAIKSSMLKKMFTRTFLQKNEDFAIFYTNLGQKQLVLSLGKPQIHRSFQIICELDSSLCQNVLKDYVKKKQNNGEYNYLFIKILNEQILRNNLVRDWKLINEIVSNI